MDKEISNALSYLEEGASIIYPTETLWALGCDATSEVAVDRLSSIKGRIHGKGYVLVVDGLEMLSAYVGHITNTIRSISSSNRPTTVVFPEYQNLPPNVLGPDRSVAIRITHSKFCKSLIREFGKPLVSTSANFSGGAPPTSFEDIDPELLTAVQYVINLPDPEPMSREASRIVKLSPGGDIETIR